MLASRLGKTACKLPVEVHSSELRIYFYLHLRALLELVVLEMSLLWQRIERWQYVSKRGLIGYSRLISDLTTYQKLNTLNL